MKNSLLDSSSRVAFAALLHDLGKFAQRAQIKLLKDKLDAHLTLYCPFNKQGGFHSHQHAAYTGVAFDEIEKYCPDLINQSMYPFISRDTDSKSTNSLINAAAAHHKPDTFLQWIIATADRVASGFEREEFEKYNQMNDELNGKRATGKNHYQARLLTLFEQIGLEKNKHLMNQELDFCYPLKELSAANIFPSKRQDIEPSENSQAQKEYLQLWDSFLQSLDKIPPSHRQSWQLWLDHFDTGWQSFTSCIPSATAFGVKPEVSLYDHSKTTAALATALWRWHEECQLTDEAQVAVLKERQQSWGEKKFLLIQGDFFGIQDFIFSGGSDSNKQAAKLLRGRSFQVSLFSELAALKLLQACDLPSTSQIMNAAGKFLIVAPNTESVLQNVQSVQQELNQWFVEQTYGLVGLGFAVTEASCNDFIGNRFKGLMNKLFQQLEVTKLQRLDLTDSTPSIQNIDYSHGVCRLNSRFPAAAEGKLSTMSDDQVMIGEQLVKKDCILICEENADIFKAADTKQLKSPIFGYNIVFTKGEEETGKFGKLVESGELLRCWDFSLPKNTQEKVWNGYARRYINAYIPVFDEENRYSSAKYTVSAEAKSQLNNGGIKTLDYIACEDRKLKDSDNKWIGQSALMTLKGDVDNLGAIFQKGLETPTFAKIAALSRQMNQFFSLWLPTYCAEKHKNCYTVFAGGDDFLLLGPWHSTQQLAFEMHKEFKSYVAENTEIHFSAGLVMSKVGLPVPRLGELAELALENAKSLDGKNAVTIFNRSISWRDWQYLRDLEDEIERLAEDYSISTSYLYSLIHLAEQAELAKSSASLEANIWRSRFAYRTARYVLDKQKKEERARVLNQLTRALGNGLERYGKDFNIPLFNYFYKQR